MEIRRDDFEDVEIPEVEDSPPEVEEGQDYDFEQWDKDFDSETYDENEIDPAPENNEGDADPEDAEDDFGEYFYDPEGHNEEAAIPENHSAEPGKEPNQESEPDFGPAVYNSDGKSNDNYESDLPVSKIDEKVTEIEREKLPGFIEDTFSNGDYRTVVTQEDVKLYRLFGGQADAGGSFATTEKSITETESRQQLALLPEWGNTCKYEAEITIPENVKLNIGLAEEQKDSYDGFIYKGGGEQVLLPHNWFVNHPEWITDIRVLKENDYD